MNRILISAVQPPFYDNKSLENNTKIIKKGIILLKESLEYGAKFCCFPEYFNVMGVEESKILQVSRNGIELLNELKSVAKEFSAYIALPLIFHENGWYYNRTFLIGDNGDLVGYYDKIHLTLYEKNKLNLKHGNTINIYQTKYGKVSFVVCYDIYFPELISTLRLKKPDIIFMPALQRSEHELASEAMLKTRAMDTQSYIIRSSYGRIANLSWKKDMMFGQSCIVHPDGTFLANAGHYEGFAMACVSVPFGWKRQRCGGCQSMLVSEFINEDRRPDIY